MVMTMTRAEYDTLIYSVAKARQEVMSGNYAAAEIALLNIERDLGRKLPPIIGMLNVEIGALLAK